MVFPLNVSGVQEIAVSVILGVETVNNLNSLVIKVEKALRDGLRAHCRVHTLDEICLHLELPSVSAQFAALALQ
jgi:hypothetical protein